MHAHEQREGGGGGERETDRETDSETDRETERELELENFILREL